MANKKAANSISKIINQLHGIDKQKPLVEGVDYHSATDEQSEAPALSQEFIDSMRQRSLDLLTKSKGMKNMLSNPIMSSVTKSRNDIKINPTNTINEKNLESKKESNKNSKKIEKKDPQFTEIPGGEVRPLKSGDSISDILSKICNFMFKKYYDDKKKIKDEKKYKINLVNLKEKRTEELIKLFGGTYKAKIIKKEEPSLFSKILSSILIGVGLMAAAKSAFANVDLKNYLPQIPSFSDILKNVLNFTNIVKKEDEIDKKTQTEDEIDKKTQTSEISQIEENTSSTLGKIDVVKAKEVYDYLIKEKGISHEHAIGILTNIQAESSFQPGVLGDYKNGVATSGGLFQHHASRFEEMKKFVGPNWQNDWKKQIDFALSEESGKKYLAKKFESPEEASLEFTKKFEIPADTENQAKQRLKNIPKLEKAITNTEIPNIVKKPTDNTKPISLLNNNTNIINGATSYNITETTSMNYPVLLDKQYFSYG